MQGGTAVILLVLFTAVAPASQRRQPALPTLPPLSMTCPHHPDVIQASPGTCPICRMPLVPVRLDAAWMCPVHSAVVESARGSCRICQRQLIPVTVSLMWTCPGEHAEHLEPGLCGNGSPRIERRTLRPHGNHSPRHGGQFFMAPDNWHHLEGTYPRDRLFRLYVYDDYGRPLPFERLRQLQARVVTRETYDPATRRTTELAAFPLRPSRNGYLEARIDAVVFPAHMTAKVRFSRDTPEYRFDFTFPTLTKEPAVRRLAAARTAQPAAPPTPASPAAPTAVAETTAPSASAAKPAADLVAPAAFAIPETMHGIVVALVERRRQIEDLVARGEFAAIWVPAFQAKDLAVALEPHLTHLSSIDRDAAEPVLREVVRLAWLLDAAGDTGNRQQVEAAAAAFGSAITAVAELFGGGVR
jgi:hypothetical protein